MQNMQLFQCNKTIILMRKDNKLFFAKVLHLCRRCNSCGEKDVNFYQAFLTKTNLSSNLTSTNQIIGSWRPSEFYNDFVR